MIAGVALPRNAEVIEQIELLADMLELEGTEAFRVLAYRRAAQHSSLLLVRGKVERQDPKPGSVDLSDPRQKNGVASIIHLIVESAARLSLPGRRLSHTSRDFR